MNSAISLESRLRCFVVAVRFLALGLLTAGSLAQAGYTIPARMQWWYEARFGMFIHFGSYSEYGHGEWAFSNEHWEKARYQEEVSSRFDPAKFDAKEIVGAAKAAGMRYLVITAKHHEGFAMWKSRVPGFTAATKPVLYNLADFTRFERDLLRELKQECDAQGIKFGLYYSILDWSHPSQTATSTQPIFSTMSSSAARAGYINDMKAQLRELLANYDPAVMWFDGDWCGNPDKPTPSDWWTKRDGADLYAFLRGLKPDLVINERVKRGLGLGDFECPEQEVPAKRLERPWETCATLNGAWGYDQAKENAYRSTASVLQEFAQVVSRDGNYLLNIGPKGDGSLTDSTKRILSEIGAWMSVSGESVHGSTGSPFAQEPTWGYYTKRSGKLYAHILRSPGAALQVPSLKGKVTRAYLLAEPASLLRFTDDGAHVSVMLPALSPEAVDSVVVLETTGVPAAASSKDALKERRPSH